VRRLDINSLAPKMKLRKPLAHVSGEIIIGAGATVTLRIYEALQNSGITELYEIESLEDMKVLKQQAKLKPIEISSLTTGTILPSDLYDSRMRLLLAAGLPITPSFLETLRRSAQPEVFIIPLSPERELKRLMSDIEEAVVEDLEAAHSSGDFPLRVQPIGVSAQRYRRVWRPGTRPTKNRNDVSETFQNHAEQVGLLIDSFQAGRLFRLNTFQRLTEDLIEMLLGDYDLSIALALSGSRFGYLHQHTLTTSILCGAIGINFDLGHLQLHDLVAAGLLHDLGMLKIPSDILLKKQPLTNSEMKVIHRHLHHSLGYSLRATPRGPDVFSAIYEHHERGTGHGYPEGKTEGQIHDYSKYLAVADAFSAFIRNRPHRPAIPPSKAFQVIKKLASMHMLDAVVVNRLAASIGNPPIGNYVRFDDGRFGRVVSLSHDGPAKPKIAILTDQNERPLTTPVYIDVDEDTSPQFTPCETPEIRLASDAGF